MLSPILQINEIENIGVFINKFIINVDSLYFFK